MKRYAVIGHPAAHSLSPQIHAAFARQAGIAEVELTHNWDDEDYGGARNFGHLAFRVDDIYATCATLAGAGVTINRPPRDGHMAFVRSPDAMGSLHV